ncbi:polyprenyl synthetase family protein [Ferroacidibacillus organovorans]|uniref:polyprenyl synthetase family protein n=1 Tax=Ferroacidibacillus organovorans TaxID=1765683 RepID=UPI0008323D6B|nr:polyprenyl synthetase family protein [Ferroacidibacillus organovorans]
MKRKMARVQMSEDAIMKELDSYMKSVIERGLDGKIRNVIEYHLGWRDIDFSELEFGNIGKRGRPMMCILTSMLFAYDYKRSFSVAAAIEFIHSFSLIYDDIQDRDTIRRGRPSVWSLWGEDEAINVGCVLQTMVYEVIADPENENKPAQLSWLIQSVNRTMWRVCNGQQLDLELTKSRHHVTQTQYLEVITGKTAALFEAAAYLGAFCSNANERELALCRLFGENVGLAFQIFDDVVGIWGSREQGLDKPNLDLEHRKKTYPIIHAHENCQTDADRLILHRYYEKEELSERDLINITELLNRCDSRSKSLEIGYQYLKIAMQALDDIAGNEAIKTRIRIWVNYVIDKQLSTLQGYIKLDDELVK